MYRVDYARHPSAWVGSAAPTPEDEVAVGEKVRGRTPGSGALVEVMAQVELGLIAMVKDGMI